ncbi:MAG: GntR family transcriptional regulator [Christensenellales bacterium]
MRIIISNHAGVPIYEQIKEQIKSAIYSGELKEGDVLPSIRQLARDLRISVITTTRAYSDLAQEGFVVNVQGKGCFVLGQNRELVRENALREIEAHLTKAITAAKIAALSDKALHTMLDVLIGEGEDE